MRYVQYTRQGRAHPAVLYKDQVINLSRLLRLMQHPAAGNMHSLRTFIEAGEALWSALRDRLETIDLQVLASKLPLYPVGEVTLDAPLRNTHKLILLAGNYREHIREAGFRVPESSERITPQFFMKPPSTTVIGPGQPICLPRNGVWVDWEVELAVVIGKRGRHIPASQAMSFVFGYTIVNDVSERRYNSQISNRFLREKDPFMDWLHGKWFDTFAPMGPAVVTPGEIPDPHNLRLALRRNGKLEQDANTSQMLHGVPYLIHKLSEIMTLEPGDVIATGTPAGVGHSKGIFLKAGDIIECHIEGIGTLTNPVVAEE